MKCILKDMRQGKGSNGRGVWAKFGDQGQEISEDWGHDILEGSGGGQNILENSGSGYFVGQREEKWHKAEQCVQKSLSKTKICFRGDSTAGMTNYSLRATCGPWAQFGWPSRSSGKNAYLKKEKQIQICLDLHHLHVTFFSGEDPDLLLKLGRFAPSTTPRYARLSMNNMAHF